MALPPLRLQLVMEQQIVGGKADGPADHQDICHIENRIVHKLEVEHIHHIPQPDPVDQIPQPAA